MAQSKKNAAEAAEKKAPAPEAPAPKAAKPPAAKKPPTPKPGPVMYLGPNTAKGALSHGQVYKGGLPPAAAEIEGIGVMFIPLALVVEAKKSLADSTSELARQYRHFVALREDSKS